MRGAGLSTGTTHHSGISPASRMPTYQQRVGESLALLGDILSERRHREVAKVSPRRACSDQLDRKLHDNSF